MKTSASHPRRPAPTNIAQAEVLHIPTRPQGGAGLCIATGMPHRDDS